ncbi:MAG: MBL fold metallo-hydrolase [Armatimonadetes bacterium]|nr:MBL fold metallo-hydrolase [Armatimonadota bacterium]
MAQVDCVAEGIYRISVQAWGFPITLNQFLIEDEHPALIHTGTFPIYEEVRNAVAEVLDPARLAYVVVPHFESDECGGMGRFIEDAPQSTLVCSEAGAALNLSGWDYSGPVRGVREGETLELGAHTLRFIETPHVHHWDSMMVVEETTKSLFPADLFIQPGDQPPVVREDLSREMCALYREAGIFGAKEPVLQVVDQLEKENLEWIHPMHGGSLPGEVHAKYIRALRKEPFAYEGKIFGRQLFG